MCSVPLLILQFFLPVYAKRLGASTTTIGTLVALFTIGMMLVRPVLGWSIDRFGPRRFFIDSFLPTYMGRMSDRVGRIALLTAGMGVSGLATLALPALPHPGWFVLFAVIKALGVNTADPTHRALLGDHLGYKERGTGYGLAEFVGSLATAVTPPLGGWLYDTVGHSAPWYTSGLLLCAGAVWGALFLRERPYRGVAEDCH